MKKAFWALVLCAGITISCNKQEAISTVSPQKKVIKKLRKAKCDRDYIIHPGQNGQPTTYTCPKPGTLCYRDKKGNHGCGEYADPKSKVAAYTNSDGSINTIAYVNSENFQILFPDIDQILYDQIIDGELHLYKMPWLDQTAIVDDTEETCTCELTTYVLSSASNINNVNATSTVLIWAY